MAGSSYTSPTYWLYEYDSLGQVISAKRYWSDGSVVAGQQNLFSFDDIGNREYAAWGGDQWGANLRYENYTANVLNQITQRTVPPYVQTLGEAATNATVTVNNVWTTRKGTYWRGEVPIDNSSSPQWTTLTNLSVIQQPGTNLDLVTNITGTLAVPQTPQSFSYDADGNLTNNGLFSLEWDAENRLKTIESIASAPAVFKRLVEAAYDSGGRRTEKTVSTNNGSGYVGQYTNHFLYDGWNLTAKLDGGGTLLESFIWGLDLSGTMRGAGGVGGLLAWVIHTGTYAGTYFYIQDGNGNITRILRASDSAIMAEYEYDAFGRLIRATGPLAFVNYFLFSSKYYDWETGLCYYGYRYYDPETGRWLSRDPKENWNEPNPYGFAKNSSQSFIDTDGRESYALSGPGWNVTYQNSQGWTYNNTTPAPQSYKEERPYPNNQCCDEKSITRGENILRARFEAAKNYLQGRDVQPDPIGKQQVPGTVTHSCVDLNYHVLSFMQPEPKCWTCVLEHRHFWSDKQGWDHWAIICSSHPRSGSPKEILFDYWGMRPAAEDPSGFRNKWPYYGGAFDTQSGPNFGGCSTPESPGMDYNFLNKIPPGPNYKPQP